MPALVLQRCLNHTAREAVARCPECGQFYCRECITEHDDRVICASCLKKIAQASKSEPRRKLSFWPVFQGAGGFILAWFIFYTIGRMLLALPDEFHQETMWISKWTDALESEDHE
jgi:hypothetical protein